MSLKDLNLDLELCPGPRLVLMNAEKTEKQCKTQSLHVAMEDNMFHVLSSSCSLSMYSFLREKHNLPN